MKKKYTITVIIDTKHPESEDWARKGDFIIDEFDNAMRTINDISDRKMRKYHGTTACGATDIKVNVENISKKL